MEDELLHKRINHKKKRIILASWFFLLLYRKCSTPSFRKKNTFFPFLYFYFSWLQEAKKNRFVFSLSQMHVVFQIISCQWLFWTICPTACDDLGQMGKCLSRLLHHFFWFKELYIKSCFLFYIICSCCNVIIKWPTATCVCLRVETDKVKESPVIWESYFIIAWIVELKCLGHAYHSNTKYQRKTYFYLWNLA